MRTPASYDRRGAQAVGDVAGALVVLVGAVVLFGWVTRRRGLVQLDEAQVPMQFNTAIALVLLGLTLPLVRTRRRAALVTAGGVVALGAVTAAQYALDRSLGIDTLFFDPWLTLGTDVPGRMARNTALCFVALGGGALLLAVRPRGRLRERSPLFVGVVSSAVAGLALVALFGYASGVSTAYTWHTSTAMAPMTAVALIVASFGYGAAAWRAAGSAGAPRWLPVPVAVGTLAVTLFLWQALTNDSDGVVSLDRAAGVILGIGLVLAVLLGVVTAAAQTAVASRREAEARHQRDTVLRAAYAAVALADDLQTAFKGFAEAVHAAVPFDRIALTLVDEEVATLVAVAGAGADSVPTGTTTPVTDPVIADLMTWGTTVLVDDVATRYAGSPAARAGMQSFIATPIVIGGSARAILTVSAERPGAYDPDAVGLVDELSDLTGGALYTLARLDDERVTTARLRELDQLKNEFVGVVAHDLRSPMTVISGYVDTILQRWGDIDDSMKKDLLGVVSRNTRRLSTMVEDVLQVARIESGDFPYEIKPFDLGALISRTAAEMNAASPEKRVCAVLPRSLPTALGDEDRYWRVLTNLLSNAQKFSPADKPVEVRVAVRRSELEVAVADQGPGIPEAHLPRLFGKFARLAGPADGQKGTGLGLYICKALVEAQDGRIWATSTVGEGTTVTFTVPRTGAR